MKRTLTKVPDLKEISTSAISISLWSRIRMTCSAWNYRSYDKWDWKRNVMLNVTASAKTLPLPTTSIELIEKYVEKICAEMLGWIEYHNEIIFLSSGYKYNLNYFMSSLVWRSNGTINYKRTAVNLHDSPRLSDVEKYRLSCAYCLKEEIEQKWQILFKCHAFDHANDGNFSSRYPLIQYWNCYCRNTLNNIPVTRGMSLDSFMFQHERVNNWHAKEYFFDRMSVEEKMQSAISIIETKTFPWQKEMLLKLNETQRISLYVEKPAEIIINHALHDFVEDAFLAWFIIGDLINAEQFVTVIRDLCRFSVEASVVIEIWRTASSEFKHCLLNSVNDESFKIFWEYYIKIDQFESYESLLGTSEGIHKVVREKEIFRTCCKRLIIADEIPLLERLLNFCFRSNEERTQFKHHHIHSSSWFREHCEKLLSWNSDRSKRLYEFCFCNKEEFIEFGKAFTKLDKFSSYCKQSIMRARHSYYSSSFFESTWYQFLNVLLPRSEDSSEFRRDFAEKIHTLDLFQQFITDYPYEFRTKLFQELCDLFPLPAEKWTELKRRVTEEEFFLNHCTRLIDYGRLNELHEGLNYFFDTPEQSEPFRRSLISGQNFFGYCQDTVSHSSFSLSGLQILMDLITFDSLALLPNATRKCLKEFKKETIFSPRCISILRDLVDNNRFNDVKKFFDGFLDSEEDMRALRLKLCDNFECLIKKLFFEYDESVCKLWMKWWFGNKQGQRKYMREISVDTFFNDGLKKCVFQTLGGSGRKSHCTLNKDFDLGALDRFLKWYFGSAIKAKKYKLEKIDEYESIDTINALVTKGCHVSYFRKLTSFFFENDATEISKFKKKHKGERIAVMVKGVRVSL